MNMRNLKNKYYKKIDKYLLRRIGRRILSNFCYKANIVKLPYPPEYLQIDITGFCNLRCKMCPQSVNDLIKEKGVMSMPLYEKIIDSGKRAGVFSVLLVLTGEPLLNNNFFNMIKYAKTKGMKVQTSINCTLLTPEKSKEIIESRLDEIILSFDTVKKDLYEEYRNGANFDLTIANIIKFLELKKEMKKRNPFVVMVNLQQCGSEGSKPKIEEDFLQAFGKYDVWIMPKYFSNWSGIMKNEKEILYAEGKKAGSRKYKICETVYRRLVVSWDAKALSCCNDFVRRQAVGDLTKQSIMEVWNGGPLMRLRKRLIEKRLDEFPLCKNCGVLWDNQ